MPRGNEQPREARSAGALSRLKGGILSVPSFIWVTVAAQASLVFLCLILYPAGYGYDEPQHVDMAYSYAEGNPPLDPGERYLATGVARSQVGPGFPPTRPFTGLPVTDRSDRLSFEALGGDAPTTAGLPNQMVQHPPLYYLGGAVILNLPGFSGLPYDQQFSLLRLLSAALIIPLPLLSWKAAREALGDGWFAHAAAVLPLTLPNLARTGASFNNDSLLIFLGSVFTLLLVRVLMGDASRKTAWMIALVTLAAMMTKAFGLLFAPVAILAYLVAWLRSRKGFPYGPLVIVAALACIPGSVWWVRNLVLYDAIQPFGYGVPVSQLVGSPRPPDGDLLDFVTGFFRRLAARFYGGIGLPEAPTFSSRLAVLWITILLALSILGALVPSRSGHRTDVANADDSSGSGSPSLSLGRLGVVVILLPGALALFAVMAQAYRMWSGYGGVFAGVQGRYLYHAIVALAVAAAAGISALPLSRLHRWLPLAVVLGAVATQLYAWLLLIESWWVPTRAQGDLDEPSLRAWVGLATWSPWPEVVTAAAAVVPAVAAVGLVAAAARLAFVEDRPRTFTPR